MRSRARIPNLLPQTDEVTSPSLLSLPAPRPEEASQEQRDRACADAAENRNRRGSVDVIPLVCDCGARIYNLVRLCEGRRAFEDARPRTTRLAAALRSRAGGTRDDGGRNGRAAVGGKTRSLR